MCLRLPLNAASEHCTVAQALAEQETETAASGAILSAPASAPAASGSCPTAPASPHAYLPLSKQEAAGKQVVAFLNRLEELGLCDLQPRLQQLGLLTVQSLQEAATTQPKDWVATFKHHEQLLLAHALQEHAEAMEEEHECQWPCSHCTLLNDASRQRCPVCRHNKPKLSTPEPDGGSSTAAPPLPLSSVHAVSTEGEVPPLAAPLEGELAAPLEGERGCMLRALESLGNFRHHQALMTQLPCLEDPASAPHSVRGWPPVGEKIQVLRTVKYTDSGKQRSKQVQPFCH